MNNQKNIQSLVHQFCVPVAVLAFVACGIGCNDGIVEFPEGKARVRIFNAQVKSDSMSIILDSAKAGLPLASGEISQDFELASGYYHSFEIRKPGDTTATGRLAFQRYLFADKQPYTLIVRGNTITDFFKPIIDTLQSPFTGMAALRVINTTQDMFVRLKLIYAPKDTIIPGTNVVDAQTARSLVAVSAGNPIVQLINDDNGQLVEAEKQITFQNGKCYHLFVYDTKVNNAIIQQWKCIEVQ